MMKFDGQKPDERIVFMIKKHPAILFRPILYLTLLTLLPVAAFVFFKFSWVFSYTFFLWLILAGAYGFNVWYSFLKTQYILTNQRLISFEQKHLFYKHVLEVPLSKIQDARAKVKGFWPSMWDFGTVYISSSAEEKVALEQVEEPRKLQEQIMEKVGGAERAERTDKEEEEELVEEPVEEKEKEGKKKKSLDGPKKIKEDFWD